MTEVQALKCPKCKDVIFSRARHDFHSCSCGAVSVDGGFDYFRCQWALDIEEPESLKINLKQTQDQLYRDWNLNINRFGIISEKVDD